MRPKKAEFEKITAEHVCTICKRLVDAGVQAGGGSYFVKFQDKELPAKRVLKEAFELANGREISVNDFSGGSSPQKSLRTRVPTSWSKRSISAEAVRRTCGAPSRSVGAPSSPDTLVRPAVHERTAPAGC